MIVLPIEDKVIFFGVNINKDVKVKHANRTGWTVVNIAASSEHQATCT
jgi:hypothetical protein